ncbi:MAG: sigma-70 family RNA polymerase sigma factor [Longimicrobiales bacterium]
MTTEKQGEFQSLLEPVLDSAFGMAMSYTGGSEADAEDLVQDSALKAFKGFASFERGTNFKAWFFRILMNTAVSRFRTTKRRPTEVDIDDAAAAPLLRQAAQRGIDVSGSDPAKAFVERIRLDSIHEAIGALPPEFRQACVLYFLEEFTYPEIAEVLDIPVGTVRSRLHRARKVLQRRLLDAAVEDGIIATPAPEAVEESRDAK